MEEMDEDEDEEDDYDEDEGEIDIMANGGEGDEHFAGSSLATMPTGSTQNQ